MHDPKVVEMVARAIAKRHSKIAGGCFAPSDIPEQPDDCADGICYCAKTARRDATVALDALAAAGWQRVPPDWMAVPREPTREMLEELSIHVEPGDGYRMMLTVAPRAEDQA